VSEVNSRFFNGITDRLTTSFTSFGAAWSAETRYGYNRVGRDRVDGFFISWIRRKRRRSPGGGVCPASKRWALTTAARTTASVVPISRSSRRSPSREASTR